MERLYITKAENMGNLTVSLTFSDNTVQTVDIGDFIRRHPHPQYNKYLDPRKFSRFTIDNGNIENAADVMYQVDIYSNLIDGKKVQAKAILALIDNQMSGYRFQRTYSNPVPNFNDARVYRITARYRRMITTTERI